MWAEPTRKTTISSRMVRPPVDITIIIINNTAERLIIIIIIPVWLGLSRTIILLIVTRLMAIRLIIELIRHHVSLKNI